MILSGFVFFNQFVNSRRLKSVVNRVPLVLLPDDGKRRLLVPDDGVHVTHGSIDSSFKFIDIVDPQPVLNDFEYLGFQNADNVELPEALIFHSVCVFGLLRRVRSPVLSLVM